MPEHFAIFYPIHTDLNFLHGGLESASYKGQAKFHSTFIFFLHDFRQKMQKNRKLTKTQVQ